MGRVVGDLMRGSGSFRSQHVEPSLPPLRCRDLIGFAIAPVADSRLAQCGCIEEACGTVRLLGKFFSGGTACSTVKLLRGLFDNPQPINDTGEFYL